ncbi:glycoside hydrolase family 71/99-like protein [Algoriphagus aquimarinus]|uniref:glycoside hydrolase family 71/99-like protein n=1 Tax=Algoriphagus aquimarinus TaxID=237018 RepID=UPI0030DA24E8
MKRSKHMFLTYWISIILLSTFGCSESPNPSPDPDLPTKPSTEIVYDETGLLYTKTEGLVMAGYQGWFGAEGDDSNRGWYHYQSGCGFQPGCSTIDMWADVSEYPKTYPTDFKFENGETANLFSSYDAETTDLHFKWMKEYGIDGVYLQRFVVEVKESNAAGKRHFDKVLENALAAAKKYDRTVCIMYDLSGATAADVRDFVEKDYFELVDKYKLFDNKENPTYLRENGKPLVAVWGVGFNDNRKYTIDDASVMLDKLKGSQNRVSVMLGVPYWWRSLGNDTENNPKLHELIKKSDVIMPWAVGRYSSTNYGEVSSQTLVSDLQWCKSNDVKYIPLVFPGFSWGNMNQDTEYNAIPRLKGDFYWQQINGAVKSGAKSLYVAMFDEIDEGTAIFKVLNEGKTPLNADGKFIGIDPELPTDHYLYLTGQAGKWVKGDGSFSSIQPAR